MIKSGFEVKTVGELLKEKRKAKGLQVKQVAEVTRIRGEYLKALEQGDYSVFPSEVYLKGFLKNYAKFLGISREKAMAMYRRENKETQEAKIETKELKAKADGPTITPEKLIFAIISIVTLSVIYYISTQVSSILQKPDLSISQPISVTAEKGKGQYETIDKEIEIRGKVSAGATLTLNGDEVITNNLSQFEVRDLELIEGLNEFIFVAESQFGRKSEISLIVNRTIIEKTNAEIIPDSTSAPTPTPTPTEISLTFRIVNDIANVQIITDGSNTANQVFQVDEKRTFTATESIILITPRPTNLRINVNGESYTITTTGQNTWRLENGEIIFASSA